MYFFTSIVCLLMNGNPVNSIGSSHRVRNQDMSLSGEPGRSKCLSQAITEPVDSSQVEVHGDIIVSEGNSRESEMSSTSDSSLVSRSRCETRVPTRFNDYVIEVRTLSQYMHIPWKSHLQVVFRVLMCLKLSPGKGVWIDRNEGLKVKAYVDAEWDKCVSTRRSVTEFCIYIGNSLVSWKSKKQETVYLVKLHGS